MLEDHARWCASSAASSKPLARGRATDEAHYPDLPSVVWRHNRPIEGGAGRAQTCAATAGRARTARETLLKLQVQRDEAQAAVADADARTRSSSSGSEVPHRRCFRQVIPTTNTRPGLRTVSTLRPNVAPRRRWPDASADRTRPRLAPRSASYELCDTRIPEPRRPHPRTSSASRCIRRAAPCLDKPRSVRRFFPVPSQRGESAGARRKAQSDTPGPTMLTPTLPAQHRATARLSSRPAELLHDEQRRTRST